MNTFLATKDDRFSEWVRLGDRHHGVERHSWLDADKKVASSSYRHIFQSNIVTWTMLADTRATPSVSGGEKRVTKHAAIVDAMGPCNSTRDGNLDAARLFDAVCDLGH